VQYHLGMLREAGLLVYRSKGTRISGVGGPGVRVRADHPHRFDDELGIRTVGEGATRRPVGIAREARTLLGKLAKKAARKTRRRPVPHPGFAAGALHPNAGWYLNCFLYRSHLAFPLRASSQAGKQSPSPGEDQQQQGAKGRKLNKIGRRYQLARELITQVPWLSRRLPAPHRLDHPPRR
jgi:hypothetical protein